MTHWSRFTSSPSLRVSESLKQPSLFIRIVNSFLFILLSVGLFQQSFASTFKSFDIEITPPQNYFVAGQPVSANVLVRFHVPAQSVRILIQGEGVVQGVSQTEEITGPQSSGYEHTLQLIATPQDLGFGMLTITVEALDTNRQSRQGKFFLLAEENFTWVSGSSFTDLRISKLETLLKNDKLRSKVKTQETLEDIVTLRVKPDNTPINSPEELNDGTRSPREGEKPPVPAVITVTGRALWTDKAGGQHEIPSAPIEIRQKEFLGDSLLIETETDAQGYYSAVVVSSVAEPEIFVRVYARSKVADIKPHTLIDALIPTYRLETLPQKAKSGSLTINPIADVPNDAKDEEAKMAFSIHHALVIIGDYVGYLAGQIPSHTNVFFPAKKDYTLWISDSNNSFYGADYFGTAIYVGRSGGWEWDVLHHEYGHYVMAVHGFVAKDTPGGSHFISDDGDNLAAKHGKAGGIKMAWSEGWPTFFGISGQLSKLGQQKEINLVTTAGDVWYKDWYSMEELLGKNQGEDNEVAVQVALFDLWDGERKSKKGEIITSNEKEDKITLSDRELFKIFANKKPSALS